MKKASLTVVCVSDSHSRKEWDKNIPPGDILIHCGDFTLWGDHHQIYEFVKQFTSLPHKYKILIAGNHDISMDTNKYNKLLPYYSKKVGALFKKDPFMTKKLVTHNKNIIYLENESVEIEGYKFWGSPLTPIFFDNAFQYENDVLLKTWKSIPVNIDVLITHGPAYGHRDLAHSGTRAGCPLLESEIVSRIKPKYHICGHIHEGYGIEEDSGTTYINCCIVNRSYKCVHKPIVFELPKIGSENIASQNPKL